MQAEHQALEVAIHALQDVSAPDLFALRRLKKRKLQLKDTIARMRSRLIPDLNA
ncbi:YdcH family protein [Thioalkalivibrio sp.]|uniref:YdcH family protein n=1 Tax=Thioalkalivibrio sp. TaxID=2093813 RepID=UPI0025D93838|nr:YdcH family protein [Thioalkalivibrio sp.]